MGADETRAAIDTANRALPAWRALTAKERANILRNWFNLMMGHQTDLARLMTSNRVNRWLKPKAKISYAASLLSGLPKKANAFMATPFRSSGR
ncbi:aldehyde dehydrogenase family protein [Escherichia coli]